MSRKEEHTSYGIIINSSNDVTRIVPGSPAQSKIRVGDTIKAINGTDVLTDAQTYPMLKSCANEACITLQRKTKDTSSIQGGEYKAGL